MEVTSPDFKNNMEMPVNSHFYKGNKRPSLLIKDLPPGVKSLAIIVDDPDAPGKTWVHWIIWNLPVVNEISSDSLPSQAVEGLNDYGRIGYGGPAPPSGTHRYLFNVYALDTLLELDSSSSTIKQDLIRAMKGHVIAEARLTGLFSA
jgi:hypothetical protein